MKRLQIISAMFTISAMMGCNTSETNVTNPETPNPSTETEATGNLLKEFEMANGTIVRFQEMDGMISLSLQGHVNNKEKNAELEEKLFQAKSMEAAYREMDPTGKVPQAILDFDKRPLVTEEASTSVPTSLNANSQSRDHGSLPKASATAISPADAAWDWTADANWWMGSVVGYPCSWKKAAHMTNMIWADDWREGWGGRGYLMAASHTYGANAYAYVWSNGAWVQTNSYSLSPRHYIIWSSGDTSKRYRRYRVEGLGGNSNARTHWGMRWETQAPSNLGVICQG